LKIFTIAENQKYFTRVHVSFIRLSPTHDVSKINAEKPGACSISASEIVVVANVEPEKYLPPKTTLMNM